MPLVFNNAPHSFLCLYVSIALALFLSATLQGQWVQKVGLEVVFCRRHSDMEPT